MDNTFVNQVMSKNVLTSEKSTSLQDAAQEMKSRNVGCVVVTDKSKPIGIVTERDFVTKVAAEGRPLFTEISEVMSSPLITVEPEETIWEASEIMKEKLIHKLPVIENEQVIGVITTSDIVRISSVGSDSQMRKICDQILMRMKDE
ncbi:Inosine-5'-monophosphate dehydrogenase protein [Marine Group I thaumarchaeote SCGC AAA799-E16]|uniref:Inosine-5'-monophosphate dehydrogenase protein n=4 Tax=Marine Group I TaxID=905826 RepID=A0A087S981_9ARCH|nr:Inosine-5'-monophosphate dehydrogenase protein [Marine Group I thaumarchaeote SCGC AAA799-N04]KER06522.1 Inosine-5'-monophosphate dehydrogenase protein [Marine Group I thaumarchaeote SCGC AAA799-E16]KFM18454.1 Inosine-5'-monophosphate dehydrogenase protein [Marine Group I thaumarchaeote SCGC RSA3]KFM22285.1 Inosine-5'-monophosphate dehydrogenase protein [Marine Group I thaumarchaeote SCGC AAA799-B03]